MLPVKPKNWEAEGLRRDVIVLVVVVLVATLTWFSYQPGMGGVFLLDDEPNLSSLNDFNADPSWQAATQFALSGTSGPSGRPLSMAAFLPNALDWPDNAGQFRRTNLLLHLINGLLLLAVMLRLAPHLGPRGRWVAVLTTCLWLVHPLHTATVLYVVQRMVLLSTAFMLTGMWIYLIGRSYAERGHTSRGAWVMLVGLATGVGVGGFAKENAALLPACLLGLELSLLPAHRLLRFRRFTLILLIAPLAIIAFYLLARWPDFSVNYSWRAFSLPERLMTEARVLLEYLRAILIPHAGSISIFHDGYAKSTSLIHPPSTLAAIIFWVGLILVAIHLRRAFPIVVGGVFWFLSAHLLESTILPLELYYDHRNYLASVGVLWILVYLLFSIPVASRGMIASGTAAILLALYAALTYTLSTSYGDPLQAAIVWPEQQPDSARVRQFAVSTWLQYGAYANAEAQMAEATKRHPTDALLWLELAQMQCAQQKDTSAAVERAISEAETSPLNIGMLDVFDDLHKMAKAQRCSTLSVDDLLAVSSLLLKNPYYGAFNDNRARIWHIRSQLLSEQRKFTEAVDALEQARRFKPDLEIRFWQYVWLLTAGQRDAAQQLLEKAREEATAADATDSRRKEYDMIIEVSRKVAAFPNGAYSFPVDPAQTESGRSEMRSGY